MYGPFLNMFSGNCLIYCNNNNYIRLYRDHLQVKGSSGPNPIALQTVCGVHGRIYIYIHLWKIDVLTCVLQALEPVYARVQCIQRCSRLATVQDDY